MNFERKNFIAITGGPGTGKTTLLKSLEQKGYHTVAEVARQIIREQIETQGDALPWKNKELYTQLMLKGSVEVYMQALKNSPDSVTFFDRGIPDSLCYAEMTRQVITPSMYDTALNYRYNTSVFILPPWEEIYHTDDERKQDWEEAVNTYHCMKNTYEKYGYQTIEVPKSEIDIRTDFILEQLHI